MRNVLVLAGAGLLALAGAPGVAAADDPPPDAKATLAAAIDAYRTKDCPKAISLVAPIVAAPGSTNPRDLAQAYDLTVDCTWQGGDHEKAGVIARRAIKLDESSDYVWRVAVFVDFQAKRYAAGLDTIDQMLAAGRAGTLNSFDPRFFMQIHTLLERGGDSVNDTRLLAILANRAYDPDELFAKINGFGDYMRALYARKLLAADKRDEARKLIADLEGYEAMAEIAFDPGLLALRGSPIDFHAVVEADLARHRALVERYPSALAAINAVGLDLHRLGRNDEAIAFLKAAQPRFNLPDAYDYDDIDRELGWFWDRMAGAYAAIGKYDEMVAAFTKAGQAKEGGAANVSQIINLASQQAGFGRPAEALKTLDLLGTAVNASPYGLMQIRAVRGCAYAELGQLDKARAVLAEAVAHEQDDPATVTALYLCVGDEDAAAASYVRRLAGAETRRPAMLELADFDAPDPRAPKAPYADRSDRVRKRPAVAEAIRAAGGPVKIHLSDLY